jgi:hypothetical protein
MSVICAAAFGSLAIQAKSDQPHSITINEISIALLWFFLVCKQGQAGKKASRGKEADEERRTLRRMWHGTHG